MATNKKSFLLYADLIHTIKKLPDVKAGKLMKIILEYVNDMNPEVIDPMVDLVFEPIKQQLKRDLVDWERIKGMRSEAGKASAEAKKKKKQKSTKLTSVETVQQNSTKSTVSVNATVINNKENDVKEKPSSTLFSLKDFSDNISIGENDFTFHAIKRTGKTQAELNNLIAVFLAEMKATKKLVWQNARDAINHFINWVNKQPKNKQSYTIASN